MFHAKDYSDAALAAFGLQARRQPSDYILPALGILSVGLLAGAGLGLLLAPRSGHELREEIGRGVNRTLSGVAGGLRKVGKRGMFGRHSEDSERDDYQSGQSSSSYYDSGRDQLSSYESRREPQYSSSSSNQYGSNQYGSNRSTQDSSTSSSQTNR